MDKNNIIVDGHIPDELLKKFKSAEKEHDALLKSTGLNENFFTAEYFEENFKRLIDNELKFSKDKISYLEAKLETIIDLNINDKDFWNWLKEFYKDYDITFYKMFYEIEQRKVSYLKRLIEEYKSPIPTIKDEPQPEVAKLVFNHGINSKNVGRIEGKNFYINSRYCEYFVNGLRDEFKELYESEKTYKHTLKGNKDKNGIYQPYAESTFRTLTFKNLKNDKIFEVKQFIDENKEIIKSILLDKT